jgi:hypothetical protein
MIGLGDVLELRRQQDEESRKIEVDCADCNYCDDCQKQCEVQNA